MKVGKYIVLSMMVGFVLVAAFGSAEARVNWRQVVLFKGTSAILSDSERPQILDDLGVPADAWCFRVPMLNPRTNRQIGWGIDCLSGIALDEDGRGTLTDTVLFSFGIRGRNRHVLASSGPVTIQPALDPDTTAAGVTHITGSFPPSDNVIGGSGRFVHATGQVRISGGVNMGDLEANGNLTFDCLFVIAVDRRGALNGEFNDDEE